MPSNRIKPLLALGLMSGTSRDGIDAALIETDGLEIVRPVAFLDQAYDQRDRELLALACRNAMQLNDKTQDATILASTDRISDLHIEVVKRLVSDAGVTLPEIAVIGFHGHTVAHRADLGWTWQIGNAQRLANQLGICVVSDLRQGDIDNGGQGAPLLPVFHRALFASKTRNVAVLNLGGVANLTWLGYDGSICAFDCGMASALIDDQMALSFGQPFDDEGKMAATGMVCAETLDYMMKHPYFSVPYPKSLDRLDFDVSTVAHLAAPDAIATLTDFSAAAVATGIAQLPGEVNDLIVTGGGRKNATMMRMIADRTGLDPQPTEAFGWNGDAIEAQGFAFMAVRCLRGYPITFPDTTGVSKPMVTGVINQPQPTAEKTAL